MSCKEKVNIVPLFFSGELVNLNGNLVKICEESNLESFLIFSDDFPDDILIMSLTLI